METIPREGLMRTCTTCKETKPIAEFVPRCASGFAQLSDAKKADPLWAVLSRCKSCYNEYHVKWRSGRKEEYRASARAFYHKRLSRMSDDERAAYMKEQTLKHQIRYFALKEKVYSAYGHACACCGEVQSEFLTLDHVNNDGNAHRRSFGSSQGENILRWIIANDYPDTMQILCWNCQWGKLKCGGICPHQATRNDHPYMGVGSSDPKREPPQKGDDMVCSAW